MTVHELTQVLGELNKPSKPQITEAILLLQSLQPDPLELASIVLVGTHEDLGKWIRNNIHLKKAILLDRDIRALKKHIEDHQNAIAQLRANLKEKQREREGLSV